MSESSEKEDSNVQEEATAASQETATNSRTSSGGQDERPDSSIWTSPFRMFGWNWAKPKQNSDTPIDNKDEHTEEPSTPAAADAGATMKVRSSPEQERRKSKPKNILDISSWLWPSSAATSVQSDDDGGEGNDDKPPVSEIQSSQEPRTSIGDDNDDKPSTSKKQSIPESPRNSKDRSKSWTWPWSRHGSLELESQPKSTAAITDHGPSHSGIPSTTTGRATDTTQPAEVKRTPQGGGKSFLSDIKWPWSSEKGSHEAPPPQDQKNRSSIVKPTVEAVDADKKESPTPLFNIKWPWSSTPAKYHDGSSKAPRDKASEITSGGFIQNFARKALPDKLLAMIPWASKSQDNKKEDVFQETLRSKLKNPPPPPKMVQLEKVTETDNDDFNVVSSSSVIHLYDEERGTFEPLDHFKISIPEHLRSDTVPPTQPSAESNWYTTFYNLATLAEADERYNPRSIRIFRNKVDDEVYSTSSSDESYSVSTTTTAIPKTAIPNTAIPTTTTKTTAPPTTVPATAATMTIPPVFTDQVPDVNPSTAFLYGQRPFRQPKLAEVKQDLSGVISATDLFQFTPIQVGSADWDNIQPREKTDGTFTKWSLPEPMRADKRLLPQIDPLVRYKLKRLGKNRVMPEELVETQNKLAVGISPSGRKLDGYNSSSADECAYKQVMCKNDPDFDIGQPFVETESGEKWPHPFLFYCNWKKTDEDVNEGYLPEQQETDDKGLTEKRRIALEICSDPLKIPYQNLGADDTDYEDPLGPLYAKPAVTLVLDLFNHLWKSKAPRKSSAVVSVGGIAIEDPVIRRYQYLSLHKYTNAFKKYYKLMIKGQVQQRKCYLVYRRMLGKYTTSYGSYPVWYYFWKKLFRHVTRGVPRKIKFCNARKTQTVFYGTFASITATQYIAEHNLLPNMDDPVMVSQMALERAMEIKEKFLTPPKSETGRPHVDYIELQRSTEYENYMQCIGLLCRYQPIKMPPRVRKVFFLNYFNVLSIQTQILRIPEKEHTTYLWEMENFWEKTKGLAGCLELSLEDIYHGILRCNRIHPTKQAKVFEEQPVKGLPKEMSLSRLSLDWMDPRIHFALNIGCKSCPPIHIFSLYEHNRQLDEVAKNYVRSRVKIDVPRRLVTLPILFLWYEKDFGNNKYVMLCYLKQFMLSKDVLKLRELLTSGKSIRVRYERFDYELDHIVQRHAPIKCAPTQHKKIIPMYWGSKF